jgi:hypothetical protein
LSGQSDKFFTRQSVRATLLATEDALVKFLYDVGNDPAMIRVWELQLNPADNNRYKLNASVLLTADYQKEVPTNAAPVKPAALVKTPQGPTNVPAKAGAPAPTNAAQKAGARAAGTNSTNLNPAAARRGSPAPAAPPAPGQSAAPARAGGPAAPTRPPRVTPAEKQID